LRIDIVSSFELVAPAEQCRFAFRVQAFWAKCQ
jgi:hypothetical protein